MKYPQYTLIRTSENNWKSSYQKNNGKVNFKKKGRPNKLDEEMLRKIKDVIIGTRIAGGVVSRRQVMSIGKGVVMANKPQILVENGGSVDLTNDWARYLLHDIIGMTKRKGTTGKVEPSQQFLSEVKLSFQREISVIVSENIIPPELILNFDQTPLSHVAPGKYTFDFKGKKHVPIKGADDKRQITATFAVSANGEFLPTQLIYEGKTKRCLPKYEFPPSFHVTFSANYWSNTEKTMEYFEHVIFPYFERQRKAKGYPTEQVSLVIVDRP